MNEHDALDRPAHAALLILALEALDPGGDTCVLLWLGLLLTVWEGSSPWSVAARELEEKGLRRT